MNLLCNDFEGSNEKNEWQQNKKVLASNVRKCCLRGRGLQKSDRTPHV